MNTFSTDCIRKNDFQADTALINLLKTQWQDYINTISPYPGGFHGKGIVICAGGAAYLTCAWINITMLRMNGCTLPIEVWYNTNELNDEVIAALAELGVKCENISKYTDSDIQDIAIKPFAILHSSFREVMFLDADNNCMADPTYLFDSEQYRLYGTIFWPDFWTTEHTNPIWEITGSADFDSIEQESGQIVINKEMCWKELNLCLYFNLNREYYYEMLLGDKDTFKFAWLALGTKYNMIETHVGFCGFEEPGKGFYGLTMVQHDFNGDIVFMHRNWFKWDITKDDESVWYIIKRFKPTAKIRTFSFNYLEAGTFRREFWDIQGDVETLSFQKLFGDYEYRCLGILKDFRSSDLYSRFLLHIYFAYFRPGYSEGFTENIFSINRSAEIPDKKFCK